jgi:predicted RND superfamily exporter protein
VGFFDRFTRRYTHFIIRRAAWIVALACVLTVAGTYYSIQLYKNLRTDLEELLPHTARSVMDLQGARDRLRSTQSLVVLVFSKNPDASRRFMIDLAHEIPKHLSHDVDRVEYRIDREIRFFRENRSLFIETRDLERIRQYIQDRIDYEKSLYDPLNIFRTEEIPQPALDFGGLERKYSDKVSSYTRFKGGFYANPDESIRAALVHIKGPGGISVALRVTRSIWDIVHRLNPKSYSPDMNIRFAGDVEDFVEEHGSLISDLWFSTWVVALLVTAAMLAYYREVRMTAALVISLFMGTLWTFGIAFFTVGYLNANSAFLGSIVIGNGINFGIIVLARYLEFRRTGNPMSRSLVETLRQTSAPTLTAALAAGLSYGSLAATTFRGFHQFGIIGLIGMVLCWFSAFSVMPAMITLIEAQWPKKYERVHRVGGGFSTLVARVVGSFPRAILAVSFLALIASVVSMTRFRGEIIDTDTTKLRDKRSMSRGSGYLSRYADEVFGRYITPLIIMADSPSDMAKIEKKLKDYRDRTGHAGLVANVFSLRDFVPADQGKKIQILRQIRHLLKPSIFVKLSRADRAKVRQILPRPGIRPFGVNDLPPLVLDRFRLKNGQVGNLVIVEPVIDKVALSSAVNQNRLISELRTVADSVRLGTPVVGTLPVTVDMYQSVRHDGPRATLIAFLSVVSLVVILFRQSEPVRSTLFSLVLGVAWLMGIIFAFEFKINFLNFIALPITFGIGVDYAVNIVQRYQTEGRGNVLHAIRGTGGAVALASLTTIIGYGSLLLAGNQAFFSFGRLAIIGEVTTLTAALLSLPAFLYLRDRRRLRLLRTRYEGREAEKESFRKSA